jgi:hypothetical protein
MLKRLVISVALGGTFVVGGGWSSQAMAEPELGITLTPEETEALKLKLIQAKPNVSTVVISSFLFPGSAQAYMGHVDRTLIMWGSYLAVFAGAKAIWPDTSLTAGQRTSDLVIAGAFMGMAAVSALDAYFLARADRDEYDRLINRLADKIDPSIKGIPSIPTK